MAASKNINGIDEAQIRQLIDGWAKELRAVGQKNCKDSKSLVFRNRSQASII